VGHLEAYIIEDEENLTMRRLGKGKGRRKKLGGEAIGEGCRWGKIVLSSMVTREGVSQKGTDLRLQEWGSGVRGNGRKEVKTDQ